MKSLDFNQKSYYTQADTWSLFHVITNHHWLTILIKI